MNQKKSAVDLTELAFAIVILGISVSIGAVVLTNMRDSQVTNLGTYSVSNETVTTLGTTGDTLDTTWVKSVETVTNSTGGEVLNTGNYTYTIDSGTGVATLYSYMSANANTTYNNSNVNVTYTVYNISDPRFAIPSNATSGLAEYGNWFKILAIVGIAAVVLAIIFISFGNRNQSNTYGGTY